MCSVGCPCAPSTESVAWTSLTTEQRTEYGRTLPFKFDGKATDAVKPYETFGACMTDIIAGTNKDKFDPKNLEEYQTLAKK